MNPSNLEEKEPVNGEPESTSTLINTAVLMVFDGLKTDIRTHPGGIEAVASGVGVDPQTIRAWWNPKHERRLTLSNLVELAYVCPLTNTRNALNTVADMFASHHQVETARKLTEIKTHIGGALK